MSHKSISEVKFPPVPTNLAVPVKMPPIPFAASQDSNGKNTEEIMKGPPKDFEQGSKPWLLQKGEFQSRWQETS